MPELFSVIALTGGSISYAEEIFENTTVIELLGGFAVISAPASVLELLVDFPEILYLEYEKLLSFQDIVINEGICGNNLPTEVSDLTGEGVLIGIPDSGISYTHPAFIKSDGTSRIVALWDQTGTGNPPEGYPFGSFYTGETLLSEQPFLPDPTGHGTATAGLASAVAPGADLAIVKLAAGDQGFPKSTELITAVDFLIRTAISRNQPYVISISYGTNNGNHTGTTLMEEYLNRASNYGKGLIVAGSGNEANLSSHTGGSFTGNTAIPLVISPYQPDFSIEIWFSRYMPNQLTMTSPGGEFAAYSTSAERGNLVFSKENVTIALIEPTPFSFSIGIRLLFTPENAYVTEGTWEIALSFREKITESYNAYLPSQGQINPATRFLFPTPEHTLTIPSCADRVLTVGAYNSYTDTYAPFSGRGYTRNGNIKPDLVAPGVNLQAPFGNSYRSVTGTSFAAPIAAGACTLLLEWGILRGNDPFLYGERLKYYLRQGAKDLPEETIYPNPKLGYGALCLRNSFPN